MQYERTTHSLTTVAPDGLDGNKDNVKYYTAMHVLPLHHPRTVTEWC